MKCYIDSVLNHVLHFKEGGTAWHFNIKQNSFTMIHNNTFITLEIKVSLQFFPYIYTKRCFCLPWFGSWGTCVSPCWPQPELCGGPLPCTGTTAQGHSGLSSLSGYCHAVRRGRGVSEGRREDDYDSDVTTKITGRKCVQKHWWKMLLLRKRIHFSWDAIQHQR